MSARKPAPSVSPGRRRLFTGAMLLLPVLFFLLLEGALRLVGYGDDYPLFVETPGHADYRYQSRDVARRYFSRRTEAPTSQIDYFRAQKDSSTLRLFVQGGSTAAGYPFYYGGSFSRMLEQRLMQTFPARRIEVVNTAMAAVNSYTLRDLADEIIAQQPDAVLVYAGHNEYYGALGVGSSESLGRFPFVVNLYLRLQKLRTVQALRDVLVAAAGLFAGRSAGEAPGATLMERMVGEQSIPYGSPLYRMGLRQFQTNLSALLAKYRRRGIPVFVGTLASNERGHRPFVSGLAAGTDADAWQARFRQGVEAAARGDTVAALAALGQTIALDSLAAAALYARGRLLDAAGHYAEARADLVAAKDRDQLRFRAAEDFNRIIREEAARFGAVVVETREALAAASPGGIIGDNLMVEHLHPNVDGYFLLADAFYEALRREGFGDAWDRPVPRATARREVLLTAVDSLHGVLRVRKLMRSWPFQPPGVVDRSLDTLKAADPVEEIALQLARGALKWPEANDALRGYYVAQGDFHNALKVSLAMIQEFPFAAPYYLYAGNALVRLGRLDEALTYFAASNDLEESAPAQRMIGSILLQRGQHAGQRGQMLEAVAHLERAVALQPDDGQSLYNLSGAYALTGQYDLARQTVRRLLDLAPDHRDGQRLLASLPPPAPP